MIYQISKLFLLNLISFYQGTMHLLVTNLIHFFPGFLGYFNAHSHDGVMGKQEIRAVLNRAGVDPTSSEIQEIIDMVSVNCELLILIRETTLSSMAASRFKHNT